MLRFYYQHTSCIKQQKYQMHVHISLLSVVMKTIHCHLIYIILSWALDINLNKLQITQVVAFIIWIQFCFAYRYGLANMLRPSVSLLCLLISTKHSAKKLFILHMKTSSKQIWNLLSIHFM